MRRDQTPTLSFASDPPAGVDWSSLIEAIGTQEFEPALKSFLSGLVGAQVSTSFAHEAMEELATCCDRALTTDCSPALRPSQRCLVGSRHWIHFDDGMGVAISGPLQAAQPSERVARTGGALAAILRKHREVANGIGVQPEPLSCLRTIEQCLGDCSDLPTREVQVCARILFGLSSAGIAIDLDVCETTIKTYRKRAYQRLLIGSERELITWYLRAWSCWQRGGEWRGSG